MYARPQTPWNPFLLSLHHYTLSQPRHRHPSPTAARPIPVALNLLLLSLSSSPCSQSSKSDRLAPRGHLLGACPLLPGQHQTQGALAYATKAGVVSGGQAPQGTFQLALPPKPPRDLSCAAPARALGSRSPARVLALGQLCAAGRQRVPLPWEVRALGMHFLGACHMSRASWFSHSAMFVSGLC